MRKTFLALTVASLMFAGIALQAVATAEPAVQMTVVQTAHASTFAQESNNSTVPPGSEGGIYVAIGGIVVFIGIIAFILMRTLRTRRKKGIE